MERFCEGEIQFKDGCFDGNFYPSFDLILVFVIFNKAVGLCVAASFYFQLRSSGKDTNIELQVVG